MVQCLCAGREATRAAAGTAAAADVEQALTSYIHHDNQVFSRPQLQEANGSAVIRSCAPSSSQFQFKRFWFKAVLKSRCYFRPPICQSDTTACQSGCVMLNLRSKPLQPSSKLNASFSMRLFLFPPSPKYKVESVKAKRLRSFSLMHLPQSNASQHCNGERGAAVERNA